MYHKADLSVLPAVIAAVAIACSGVVAQRTSVVTLNDASVRAGSGPSLEVNGLPVPGQTAFRLRISETERESLGQLIVSSTTQPTWIPSLGATLFPAVPWHRVTMPANAVGGSGSIGLGAGPIAAALGGIEFVLQGAVIDPDARGGVALTEGLALTFGSGEAAAPLFGLQRLLDQTTSALTHIADADGDGLDDIVSFNTENDVAVRFALGGGFFSEPLILHVPPVGLQPWPYALTDLTVADLDGDGHPDIIAIVRPSTLRMDVFYGRGAGEFELPVSSTPFGGTGPYFPDLVVTDVNSDSCDDIVVLTSSTSKAIRIVLGSKDREIADAIAVDVATPSPLLSVGDVDGNGVLDLVTVGRLTDEARLTLGFADDITSELTFGTPMPFWTGGALASHAALGDLDGDELPELVVVHGLSPDESPALVIHPNVGGIFGSPVNSDVELLSGRNLMVVDATLDGHLDVVVRDAAEAVFLPAPGFPGFKVFYEGDFIHILEGQGDGTFTDGATQPLPISSYVLTLAQFDHDPAPDYFSFPCALLGQADQLFTSLPERPPSIGEASLADFNGDGLDDVIATSSVNPLQLGVWTSRGDGTFDDAISSPAETIDPFPLAIADIDGDGALDLTALTADHTQFVWMKGDGQSAFGPPLDGAATMFGADDVFVIDLNEDGLLDVVTSSSSQFSVALAQDVGVWTAGVPQPVSFLTGIAAADVTGDGHVDLVLTSCTQGVVVYAGDGTGVLQPPASVTWPVAPHWVSLFDINGDDTADIVAGSRQGIAFSSPSTNASPTLLTPVGDVPPCLPWHPALAVDVNGDGRRDLLTSNRGVEVRLARGDGTLDAPVEFGELFGPIAAGNLDGDAFVDLVLTRVQLNAGFERAVTGNKIFTSDKR